MALDKEQGHCSGFWVRGEIMPVIAGGEHLPVWPVSGQLQRLNKPPREIVVIPEEIRHVPQFAESVRVPAL